MSDFSYSLGILFFRVFSRLFTEFHVEGANQPLPEGGCLFMANHISHFDPPLFAISVSRPIDYMADLPLFKIPIIGPIIRSWHAFPVDRTKIDRASIRTALQKIEKGRIVGIFPERGIRTGENSIVGGAELSMGTISLWQMAGVPILPAIIIGSDQLYQWRNFFRRRRLLISYGPLLPAPGKEETREQLRDRLVQSFHQLYQQMVDRYQLRKDEFPVTAQERWARK